MKKIVMVTPHLSTGGLPQYTYKMIEHLRGDYEVWCVEWDDITGGILVVQKNRIGFWLNGRSSGDRLVTLGEDKYEFLRLIDSIEPDIIHFQEIPETFVQMDILSALWRKDRNYEIVVTTHSSHTDPSRIKYCADRYVLVSRWSRARFANVYDESMCHLWEYPQESRLYDKASAKERLGFDPTKKHVLHVGLFTPGKNQAQIFEIARKLESDESIHFHFVGNQADNFRDYWEPLMAKIPANCTWHGERHDVDEFYKAADVFIFPSLFELNPLSLIEARSFGLPIVMRNLETYSGRYDDYAHYIGNDLDDAVNVLMSVSGEETLYGDIQRNGEIRIFDPIITTNFINGPYVFITGCPGETFDVTFTDAATGIVHYKSVVYNDCWTKSTIEYVVDWKIIVVRQSDGKSFEERFDPTGKKLLITLDSRSLGDTMAWFPQVERFRQKWNCQVVCSTFWNSEFSPNYKEIEFIEPGMVAHGIYGMFSIGWFFDGEGHLGTRHPRDFKKLPLQQTASDTLGLDYVPTKAILTSPLVQKRKRIGLGIHSTAQTKYWNNPTGWQELTNFFRSLGYEVVVLSNEGDGYMGNNYPNGVEVPPPGDFETLKGYMLSCEIFVGVGSGLSWLAWTLGVPTVLISGFSEPISEFEGDDVIRVFNEDVCNGCYNRYRFNPGDWNWCPDHKDTDRQFECTKSIQAKDVISKIVEKGWVSFL